MQIIWASTARQELADIIEYIGKYDPFAAIQLDEKVDHTLERITKFPYSGRKGKVENTREAVIGSYILVYEVENQTIYIDSIYHSSRIYPPNAT